MRTALALTVILAVAAVPRAAHAEGGVGLGIFVGDPFGLDLKIDLQRRSALDVVIGVNTIRDGRTDYGHLTYLVTPVIGHGRSVAVPLRLGIGVAVFNVRNDVDVGVRAPLEVAFMFRSAPIELYGEIALLVPFVHDVEADLQGGIGFRIYF
jgi:hypothetical protein